MKLTPIASTRLEKAAADDGFDLDLGSDERWLRYGSSQAPLRLWLSALGDGFFIVAMSQGNVVVALDGLGAPITSPIPPGAACGRSVAHIPALRHVVRRAFQLSRTFPDDLLHVLEARVAGLPRETEAERLVVQRVGQDVFRDGLLDFWEGRCAVTGLARSRSSSARATSNRGQPARPTPSASTCSTTSCWRRTSTRLSTAGASP